MSEPITNLSDAVAAVGALPVPQGPVVMEPLSVERLDAIAARAEAATAGPWCTDSWEIYQGAEYEPGLSLWVGETCRGTSSPEQDCADAEFVAAARADVPALVAEVRRLLAERRATNEALSEAAEALREKEKQASIVAEFVAARAEYITALRNCPAERSYDYDRWQGHAAARRQLAESLGLPVAWPPEDAASVQRSADELTQVFVPLASLREVSDGEHYAAVHHDYRTSHDLPETGGA